MIERRESGSPVGLLSTGISKNCAPRKKAAPRGSCIVRDLYFSNTTFFFLFLFLFPSFSTPSYDPFSPRFSRENGKLVRCGREKARDERIFPSIPRAFSPRFRFPLEKFCAKDGLFSRQPGINERRARMCIRVVRQIGLEYLFHEFFHSKFSRGSDMARREAFRNFCPR